MLLLLLQNLQVSQTTGFGSGVRRNLQAYYQQVFDSERKTREARWLETLRQRQDGYVSDQPVAQANKKSTDKNKPGVVYRSTNLKAHLVVEKLSVLDLINQIVANYPLPALEHGKKTLGKNVVDEEAILALMYEDASDLIKQIVLGRPGPTFAHVKKVRVSEKEAALALLY